MVIGVCFLGSRRLPQQRRAISAIVVLLVAVAGVVRSHRSRIEE